METVPLRKRLLRLWESGYPTLLGLFTSSCAFSTFVFVPYPNLKNALTVVVAVSAILTAFLTTTQTMSLAVRNEPLFEELADSGHLDRLYRFISFAVRANLLSVVLAMLLLLVLPEQPEVWVWLFYSVVAGVTATGIASCYRVVDILTFLLRLPRKKKEN